MKRWFSVFLFLVFIATNTVAYEHSVVEVFYSKRIDISAKSYLGWARVLNDPAKRKEYNLDDLSHSEITMLTEQLKELSKKNSGTFEGKLK